jgi:hypothetical protein
VRESCIYLIAEKARSFAEGASFGEAGPYEIVTGRARVHVAPDSVPAGSVDDLELAELDGAGRVVCTTDFAILKPVDAHRGNRRILFDYPNRGCKRALQFFNDAPFSNRPRCLAHAGNGYLMRRGYTVLWIAWQGDMLDGDGRLLLDLPVASDQSGLVTGTARSEFIVDEAGVRVLPLSGRVSVRSHPVASLDKSGVVFTRQKTPDSEPIAIADGEWAFAREETGVAVDFRSQEQAVLPSRTHVRLEAGFQPGWIYRLQYTASEPLILGLGQIVVRDLVDFFRRRPADDRGTANPLAGTVDKAYAWGRSQTGRAIRDFIYRGFNALNGRAVFDGVIINASGAGRLDSSRFANLNAAGSQQYEEHDSASDIFPFAYAPTRDPHTGAVDAILKRPDSDPLVIHISSSSEYWQRRASLVHTDAEGADLPDLERVRLYHWASSPHSSDPNAREPLRGRYDNLSNIVQVSFFFRAVLDALDNWATNGRPPPDSSLPRVRDGTLVSYAEWRASFPVIPGLTLPADANRHPSFPTFVPAVDCDGNETGGVQAPMVAAALGTYAGWNTRSPGYGDGAMHSFYGSYIPFPKTPGDAAAPVDPRRSIVERYETAEGYIAAVKAAGQALVDRGFVLQEDMKLIVVTPRIGAFHGNDCASKRTFP